MKISQKERIRFYCSPDGHSCKWLLPMVAATNYPSWDDLTALSLDELAVEIEKRQDLSIGDKNCHIVT